MESMPTRAPAVRLQDLEARVGRAFPPELVRRLLDQAPISEGDVGFVTEQQTWDVRTSFVLDQGERANQLDRLYALVGDVLPPATVPVAADWGDNFYCLVLAGPGAGQIVYWDHERDPGDDHIEPVAGSLEGFFLGLVVVPEE